MNKFIKRGFISIPSHILHIDEHHDMMDEKKAHNIANFIFHAMTKWPKPDMVSVCTSPEFIGEQLRTKLLAHLEIFNKNISD